jgi:hypothetical protein
MGKFFLYLFLYCISGSKWPVGQRVILHFGHHFSPASIVPQVSAWFALVELVKESLGGGVWFLWG